MSATTNALFLEVIREYQNYRQLVTMACDQFVIEGKTQSDCSAAFTATFKAEYPYYDFTTPRNNPDKQRHAYDNIRKAISDYWKQFKPVAVKTIPATTAPATAQQVSPAAIHIAQQPTNNDSPALAAQLSKEQIAELALNMGQQDVSWAKTLAMKLMAL